MKKFVIMYALLNLVLFSFAACQDVEALTKADKTVLESQK